MNLHLSVGSHHPPVVIHASGHERGTDWALLVGTADALHVTLSWEGPEFSAIWLTLDAWKSFLEANAQEWPLPGDAGTLKVQWTARQQYSTDYKAYVVSVRVDSVEVCGWDRHAAWRHFVDSEGHQVVAMLRLGRGGRSSQMYLGRAQSIETASQVRRYFWTLPEVSKAEEQIWEPQDWAAHVQQAWELERIRGLSKVSLSPRTADVVRQAPMDNDAYRNERHALPVTLRAQDECLQVQFFNLRDTHPCALETDHLAWGTFTGTGSFVHSVRLALSALMSLTLRYTQSEGNVQIVGIELEARHYKRALALMGLAEGPQTY